MYTYIYSPSVDDTATAVERIWHTRQSRPDSNLVWIKDQTLSLRGHGIEFFHPLGLMVSHGGPEVSL